MTPWHFDHFARREKNGISSEFSFVLEKKIIMAKNHFVIFAKC